ncbi:MAG: ATP phosphoribosyltransferase regulatory subunit [Pseudomonadota bacterium]|nr:ATP phosphoribosyltransferase regulatory subunit [Pseudomonadota bacterium]
MPVAETWLLPDGVADVLPEQAQVLEQLRRQLLDTLVVRGYELIYTPLIEYVESLLIADNSDLDLQTFKLIDQISGRLLGVRADMTPQVARIDAHVRPIDGIARYCYAATVLHTHPQGLSASRTPLQLGAELFGSDALAADLEMLETMLTVLSVAARTELHVDLGHVAIFRELALLANLSDEQEQQLFDLYQRKAIPELVDYSQQIQMGADFLALARAGHDMDALTAALSNQARQSPTLMQAIADLTQTRHYLQTYWPQVQLSVDAAEVRGYHYHTGLVFAAYTANRAVPLAQGGRYNGIGTAFGRTRPATGFSCDLYALIGRQARPTAATVVAAPAGRDPALLAAIAQARAAGQVVIQSLDAHEIQQSNVTHRMMQQAEGWQILPLDAI